MVKVEVYENILQKKLGDEYPDMRPILIGQNWDVIDENIEVYPVQYEIYDSSTDASPHWITPDFPSAEDLSITPEEFQAKFIKVLVEYPLPKPYTSREKIYIDGLYDVYYEGPESHRITVNEDHLVDEDADFLSVGVQPGDWVLLPNGIKLRIQYVTINKLYFAVDSRYDTNIDLPTVMYRIGRPYEDGYQIEYVFDHAPLARVEAPNGVLRFKVPWSLYGQIKFYCKYETNLPIQINEYQPGILIAHKDNPLGWLCQKLYDGEFTGGQSIVPYYIPLPDDSLESYTKARERLDDRGYCIVLLTYEKSIVEVFAFTNDDLKVTLATTVLPRVKVVAEGQGNVEIV